MKLITIFLALLPVSIASAQTIVCPPGAPANVKLAAREIRRYVYMRTGQLLPFAETGYGITLKTDFEWTRLITWGKGKL